MNASNGTNDSVLMITVISWFIKNIGIIVINIPAIAAVVHTSVTIIGTTAVGAPMDMEYAYRIIENIHTLPLIVLANFANIHTTVANIFKVFITLG